MARRELYLLHKAHTARTHTHAVSTASSKQEIKVKRKSGQPGRYFFFGRFVVVAVIGFGFWTHTRDRCRWRVGCGREKANAIRVAALILMSPVRLVRRTCLSL